MQSQSPDGDGDGRVKFDERRQAAMYLQKLEEARVFARYAETAFESAKELSPDQQAYYESTELCEMAAKLRRLTVTYKQRGNSRFNPKRGLRRVVIENDA